MEEKGGGEGGVRGTGGHRHGRLHGLVKSCGFWTADGSACGRL